MEIITTHNGLKKHRLADVPQGTKLGAIQYFDRSQKVAFQCPQHHDSRWVSKDPYVSTHFPYNPETRNCEDGCMVKIGDYVTIETYRPTRRL